METLTEIQQEETARRERARRYENAVSSLDNARRAIEHLTPQVEQYATQVRLLTKVDALLPDIDPKIDTGQGLFRERVITLVAIGLRDQQRRHSEVRDRLAKAVAALPAFEAAVAAFK